MINFLKVQTEILKKLVREDYHLIAYNKDDNGIWITYDGHVLRYIPNGLFFLDVNKLRESHVGKSLLNNEPLAVSAVKTSEIKELNKKTMLVKFTVDSKEKYMNKKFTDECDKWKYHKQAFYGYCNDVLCMVVMEVNVDKKM